MRRLRPVTTLYCCFGVLVMAGGVAAGDNDATVKKVLDVCASSDVPMAVDRASRLGWRRQTDGELASGGQRL